MNWTKLHNDITKFAEQYEMESNQFDTGYIGGKTSTYQISENSEIFYDLRHTKPRQEYGSKLRVYSKSNLQLRIKVRRRFFSNPKVISNVLLPGDLCDELVELYRKIGEFEWSCGNHHFGWPKELRENKILKFECKRIDLSVAFLEDIRQLHIKLQDLKNS